MKTVSIFGSTGSIGKNTIKVIEESPDNYQTVALIANSNVELLAKQAIQLNAKIAVTADESKFEQLKNALNNTNIQAAAGGKAVIEAAAMDSDIVMSAIVGYAGLKPTMTAIKRGAKIALANKECLVCAGQLMIDEVAKNNASLIPVDSEHSAIFQVLDPNQKDSVKNIILTASGGPFRGFSLEQLQDITPKQAVAHPNWDMGAKISVDSATMMNKGLEIIEAFHLFPVTREQIKVVVHPESIVHSMVEYKDGSVLAQLGAPDMRTPISVALSWPKRSEISGAALDLVSLGKLTFEDFDESIFPAISIAREALKIGGLMPAMINTANEIAVAKFLRGEIKFLDIIRIVEKQLHKSHNTDYSSIEDIFEAISEVEEGAFV